MKNCLRIFDYSYKGEVHFFTCPCRDCKGDKEIQDVYSERHAGVLGWKWICDIQLSQDEEKVYICPDCVKRTKGISDESHSKSK